MDTHVASTLITLISERPAVALEILATLDRWAAKESAGAFSRSIDAEAANRLRAALVRRGVLPEPTDSEARAA